MLTVLGPVPYLLLLLPVLSFTADVSPVFFLFIFSVEISFCYMLVKRSIGDLRENLAAREDNIPNNDRKYKRIGYWEHFKELSYNFHFGYEDDIDPISEYRNRPPFSYFGYAVWGTGWTFVIFLFSATGLALFVSSGSLDLVMDQAGIQNLIEGVPLGAVEMIGALFSLFGSLEFEVRVFVIGVVIITGFFFQTAARNLILIADDCHRRVLKFLVEWNPVSQNEFANSLLLAAFYIGVVIVL